ncbi:MAG: hypothetical protein PV340_05480 [Wolbachia sp.]|nr:hypothetical protein [Wolbachia sp.]MDD9336074.1 hypothetical protein [Wolbachia sp.]
MAPIATKTDWPSLTSLASLSLEKFIFSLPCKSFCKITFCAVLDKVNGSKLNISNNTKRIDLIGLSIEFHTNILNVKIKSPLSVGNIISILDSLISTQNSRIADKNIGKDKECLSVPFRLPCFGKNLSVLGKNDIIK